MWEWNDGHMDDGWGIATMLVMMTFWVVVITAIVFAIVWASRASAPAGPSPTAGETMPAGVPDAAEQILAERFARGEIDAEEYQSRRATLDTRGKA